jgi:hypothetical protein
MEFLEYINTKETKWECCIWLPYATSYWQVGDGVSKIDAVKWQS